MEEKLSPEDWASIVSALRGAWLRARRHGGYPNPDTLKRLIGIVNKMSSHPLEDEGMAGLEEHYLHLKKMREMGVFGGD